MPSRGSHSATFAFVSDSPSWTDAKNNYLWSDRGFVPLLHEAGYSEEDCYFTSALKCSLRAGTEGTYDQARHCSVYLIQELMAVKPKVIFVTGRLAFQVLTRKETRDGIGKLRGGVHRVNMPWGEVAIIATWTPGYARHKSSAGQDIIADLLSGRAHLEPPRQTDYRWIESPDQLIAQVDEILNLYANNKLVYGEIGVDIESNNLVKKKVSPVPYPVDHNIASIQVAWNPGSAFIVPVIRRDSAFNNPYNIAVLVDQMKRLLSHVPVCGQNYKFDESYFAVKLGLRTEKFAFDTMLGHHFLHGGSLPNNLGFMTARYLGWVSHKKIIDAELDAMPDDDRRYSNLSRQVLTTYGCTDADATLQIAAILREKMCQRTYGEFVGVPVVYNNMLEAFMARTMAPWRAILDIEIRGARMDSSAIPAVTKELEDRMAEAYATIDNSMPHAVWLLDHTVPNPKHKVYKKKSVYYVTCAACSHSQKYAGEGKKPKEVPCSQCGTAARVHRKMEPTEEFEINPNEPEKVVSPINLRSPAQVSEFFYNRRYMGLTPIEDLGTSTDKAARAALLEECEKAEKTVQAKILIAVGEYNKASKLHSAYAVRLPDYLFVRDPDKQVSTEVTSRFELPTGVDHIHTNYFQDGTVSGRLSTRSPSLHVIPRKSSIKKLFVSRFGSDGLILQADLSQAEVRAFVIETGDDDLRDAFNKGVDPYILMASKTYGIPLDQVTEDQRQANKSIVLGLLFGRGATAISEQIKKPVHVVKKLIQDFFASVPKIRQWIDRQHQFVERHKCAVSRFGRIRPLVDQIDADDDEMLNHAHNISVNHPIQGMVGDLCIDSVARTEYRMRREGMRSVIFNTVHDSCILDVYVPEIKRVMPLVHEEMFALLPTYYPWINVPFSIDMELGTSWGGGMKSSLRGDVLTITADPAALPDVTSRLRRFFDIQVASSDVSVDKSGSPRMKFAALLKNKVA